jgi:hypothetical protein
MGYIIEHLFDDPIFIAQLEFENDLDYSSSLEMLKRYRAKDHLNFKDGGGVRTLTLNARTKSSIEAAMGFGGNRLILDESSLIEDALYSTVKRMLGGYTNYSDTFLLEIGNPFYRNHFLRTWNEAGYYKIFIDYHQALKEGRYSLEFIEEMRKEAFFDVFYECLFPREDELDNKGYRRLMTLELLRSKMTKVERIPDEDDFIKLGIDIGGGGDYNSYTLRTRHKAWLETKNQSSDTMTNVTTVLELMEKYPALKDEEIYIDDVGIGRGVADRLKEMNLEINAVSAGSTALNTDKFANIKAENYWNLREWLLDPENYLDECDEFNQVSWIKYKVSSDRQIQMQPKDELKSETGKSPDHAESLMLTFSQKPRKARAFQTKAF